MTISKTRLMLVEVARQLFAQRGVYDTTMNDIAEASGKGRRTLYTYFKNKEQIYLACIEQERQVIMTTFLSVMKKPLEPEEKIKLFISTHFDVLRDTVIRNGNLHAEFFKDITEVERCRRNLDQREIVMLSQIISEGKQKGVFTVKDIKKTAQILQYSLKGLEIPFIRESVLYRNSTINHIYDFLFYGLKGQL